MTGDPTAQHIAPPWFGNLGYLRATGLIGALATFVALMVGLLAMFCLHWIDKYIIWPDACCGGSGQVDAQRDDG